MGSRDGQPAASGDEAASDELRRQWEAIDAGAALIDRSPLALMLATGEDRIEFLHGQTTNHVRALSPGQGCAALALTAQGRPLGLFALYNDAERERVVIATTHEERAPTRAALERFLVADDCELEDGAEVSACTLAGPQAAAILENAGIAGATRAEPWQLLRGAVAGRELTVLSRGDLRVPAFEVLADSDSDAAEVAQILRDAGAVASSRAALEIVRVESGRACYGIDVDESRIAIEARLEWAIHFNKGCYVGQEVIERAFSRGRIQHRLTLLAAPGAAVGAKVADGGERDVVTSAANSPRLGRIALAYLPADASQPGRQIQLETADGMHPATVLPWPR